MSILISVVVCTHNRADLLANALQSLCEQSLDSTEYEVIVVDNNSTDRTRSVVDDFHGKYPNIRYCLETEIGLSHSRNRGWQEAQGLYVAYTDDDCNLPPQWLTVAKKVIETVSSGVFGGYVFPFYNSPKPKWFKDSYGTLKKPEDFTTQSPNFIGCNIFIRRDILESLQGFDVNLGMTGKKIAYGEETDLQQRIRAIMPHEIFYCDPNLYVYHIVREDKMKMSWQWRAFFAKGRYSYLTSHSTKSTYFDGGKLFLKAAKIILSIALDLIVGLFIRNRKKYRYMQNYFYEHTSSYLKSLGRLYAQYECIMD